MIEKDLVHPLVRGRDVDRWIYESDDLRIIVPHGRDGRVIGESRMKTDYPQTYQFLHGFKKELEG